MASVFGSVEREHAGPDHLRSAEPRIVDREPNGVAHHCHSLIAREHNPPAQRADPHHGPLGAQPVHHVVMMQVNRDKVGSSISHPRRVAIFDHLL